MARAIFGISCFRRAIFGVFPYFNAVALRPPKYLNIYCDNNCGRSRISVASQSLTSLLQISKADDPYHPNEYPYRSRSWFGERLPWFHSMDRVVIPPRSSDEKADGTTRMGKESVSWHSNVLTVWHNCQPIISKSCSPCGWRTRYGNHVFLPNWQEYLSTRSRYSRVLIHNSFHAVTL